MDADGHADGPSHEAAPPEVRQLLPPVPLLIRGVALAMASIALGWGAFAVAHRSLLLAPVSLTFALGGILSAWAAAVHLTGGVKHDDHPFL